MKIPELISRVAAIDPERPAIWQPGGPEGVWATYGELETRSTALAAQLRSLGLSPGDRAAMLLDSSIDWVVVHLAVLKVGAVCVALNTELSGPSLAQVASHAEAACLLVNRRFAPLVAALPPAGPVVLLLSPEGTLEPNEASSGPAIGGMNPPAGASAPLNTVIRPRGEPGPPDLAAIVYTSGSTGIPKGVMLTHDNLLSSTRSTVEYLGLRAEDRMMVVLPLYYIYGLSLLYTHLWVGGSVVLDHRFAYPNVVLDTMSKREVTGFAGVPSTFILLLQKSTLRKRSFARLRHVTQAGGALAPSLQQEVHAAFAPARLFIMYGCTEASPRLSYVPPELLPQKWGSIGRAVPGVELTLVDEEGQEVATGESGEIAARGPNIMAGYWRDPVGTAEVLREGRYLTGDLARSDEDGFLYIVGRKREILKVGGHRVSPLEIEECLYDVPGVAEAAVVGVEDPLLGEAAVAFVVGSVGQALLAEEILRALKERLPAFKVPRSVVILDALPKNQAGKVQKSALRGRTS